MANITINGQVYIIEQGAGGYTYYRVASNQRFGKKVKARGTTLAVLSGTDGTPNPELGLNQAAWGTGSIYAETPIEELPTIGIWSISSLMELNQFDMSPISGSDDIAGDLCLSLDGSKLYVMNFDSEELYQLELSTPWDISTSSYSYTLNISPITPLSLCFSFDGMNIYFGYDNDGVVQYKLSSAWDISTAVIYGSFNPLVDGLEYPTGICLSADGTKMYLSNGIDDNIFYYTLSTPGDITTASLLNIEAISVSSPEWFDDIEFKQDGTKFVIISYYNNNIYQYDLSTAWDISTSSLSYTYSMPGSSEFHAIHIPYAGEYLYVWDADSYQVRQFKMN